MDTQNHYEILGVDRDAGPEEIASAHRRLVVRFHPDTHPDAGPAERHLLEEMVMRINVARDVLTDPRRRAEYDRTLGRTTARGPMLRPPDDDECMLCGSGPAVPVKFRQGTGYVLARTVRTFEGTFCRDCALSAGRAMQSRTLWTGWWGVISFFTNLYYVAANTSALSRVGGLRRPERDPAVVAPLPGPLSPGSSVFGRFGFWFVAAVIAVVVWVGVTQDQTGNTEYGNVTPDVDLGYRVSADWRVGNCVSGYSSVYPVFCSSPHTGRIVASVPSVSACPISADSYVDDVYTVWCIDEDR